MSDNRPRCFAVIDEPLPDGGYSFTRVVPTPGGGWAIAPEAMNGLRVAYEVDGMRARTGMVVEIIEDEGGPRFCLNPPGA